MNQEHIRNFLIIAHIELRIRHPFWVSHCAGKKPGLFGGLLFPDRGSV
jgi:hypothetical protein